MIEWSKGIVARYYASIVDPNTWRDIEDIQILSGSITYSNSGIRNSADISCRNFDHENEHWHAGFESLAKGSAAPFRTECYHPFG